MAMPQKKLDDVLCLYCLQPPHNARLIMCDGVPKGCFTLICDTSSRHSNCYDQFKKHNKRPGISTYPCPHCREPFEKVRDIDDDSRRYLNSKKRECLMHDCQFIGNYEALRRHARLVHPRYKPNEDPNAQISSENNKRREMAREEMYRYQLSYEMDEDEIWYEVADEPFEEHLSGRVHPSFNEANIHGLFPGADVDSSVLGLP